MNKKILRLLYRSFDATLTDEEQKELEQAFADSPELAREKEKGQHLRIQIAENAKHSFSPFFTERVSNYIFNKNQAFRQQVFFDSLSFVFRRIIVVGAVLAILLLSINFIRIQSLTAENQFMVSEYTLEDVLVPAFTTSVEDLL